MFFTLSWHSEREKGKGWKSIGSTRYIKVNNLVDELQRKDWAVFAKGYNGVAYKRNNYDEKLRQAYNKYK